MSEYEGYKKRFEAKATSKAQVSSDIKWVIDALRLSVIRITGAPDEAVDVIPMDVPMGGASEQELLATKAFKISIDFGASQYGDAQVKLTHRGSSLVEVEASKEITTIRLPTEIDGKEISYVGSLLWQKIRTGLEKKLVK